MDLTFTQRAFIAAYGNSVAHISKSTLIEYFDVTNNGGEFFRLDSPTHISDSWDLFCAGIEHHALYGSYNT